MNLQDLITKLQTIEEGEALPIAPTKDDNPAEQGMEEECGMMVAPGMGGQEDHVSMSINMNGQGADGVRNLMNILKDIENGADDSDIGHKHPLMGTEEMAVEVQGGEDAESWSNSVKGDSGHHTHGVDAVTFSGDDMNSKGKVSPIARVPGSNALRPVSEELVNRLQSMYDEIKESDEPKTMSRAAKGVMKYGKDGMKALAKAGKDGKDLDKVRDKYNKYDESTLDEIGLNLMQPNTADPYSKEVDPKYNDKANVNALQAKYQKMIADTDKEIADLKANPTGPGSDGLLKTLQQHRDGLYRELSHNMYGASIDDATNALRKKAIANNELTPGQWLQKGAQAIKGAVTGQPQPGVSYDRYDTSKQAKKDWATDTPYKPESVDLSDIKMLAGLK